jgi:tetratricopeptide (TPR) repeat protein/transcriptional regulator with XRE-family HTH domain
MADAFALLLRRHRLRRRLTQEALAERAEISSRSVREMERGLGRSPRPHTVMGLVDALELAGADREEFVQAGQALFWASRAGQSGRTEPAGEQVPTASDPPRQLPPDLPDFVGRRDELAVLRQVLHRAGDGRLAAISGPPGVGKTALAVYAGHRLAPGFPDGQLFAALRGANGDPADPAEVLAQLLRALGVSGAALPAGVDARAGLYRTRMAGRRVLLVLDDVAGYHQVDPLLPANAAVLMTSRSPLTGLPGVTSIGLHPLPSAAAVELLARVAGEARVCAEPAAATELVVACGGLPLAVRIAAARLAARPHWTVGTLAERLADERHRLDELRHGDLSVRSGLQLAHRELTPAAARAFALLGELGIRSVPEWPVALLLDAEPAAGVAALDELLDARLLDDLGSDQAGQPRYGFHEVTRLYARERRVAEVDPADWVAGLARVAGGWLALARQAQDRLACGHFNLDDRRHPEMVVDPRAAAVATGRPVEWFEAEREALVALVPACAKADLAATASALAGCAADFYEFRGYYDDWHRVTQAALAACRQAGDRSGESAMLRALGSCLLELDDHDEAVATLRAARELARAAGDPVGAAMASKDLGLVLSLTGQLDEAETQLSAAVEELGRVGQHPNKAIAMCTLGFVLRQRGNAAEAIQVTRSALQIARIHGDRYTRAFAWRSLSAPLLAGGCRGEAQRAARRAAVLFEQIGDDIGRAQSLRALGEALATDPHRLPAAEQALSSAAAIFRDQGHDWGMALTELSLGEVEVRRGVAGAADRLRRSLEYWTSAQVPALQARTLVALSAAAEQAADPAARELLVEAHRLYHQLEAPEAAALAARLGLPAAP